MLNILKVVHILGIEICQQKMKKVLNRNFCSKTGFEKMEKNICFLIENYRIYDFNLNVSIKVSFLFGNSLQNHLYIYINTNI